MWWQSWYVKFHLLTIYFVHSIVLFSWSLMLSELCSMKFCSHWGTSMLEVCQIHFMQGYLLTLECPSLMYSILISGHSVKTVHGYDWHNCLVMGSFLYSDIGSIWEDKPNFMSEYGQVFKNKNCQKWNQINYYSDIPEFIQ